MMMRVIMRALFGGFMAQRKLEFDVMELAWLRKSCETQRNVLVRQRGKEQVGSEIHAMRGREVDAINQLLMKLS